MPSFKGKKSSVSSSSTMDQLPDSNNNDGGETLKKSKNYEKYSLRPRSIQNRIETEKRQKLDPKKQPKPKVKPPPLSKYRRKTANARERSRMLQINSAFEALQSVVPAYPVLPVNAQGKTCEKLTKITTLRLAMNYIQELSTLLNEPEAPSSPSPPPAFSQMMMMDTFPSSTSNHQHPHHLIPCDVSSTGSSSSGIGTSMSSSPSEFSPASSFTMSPVSNNASPGPGPECYQTIMRSAVSPPSGPPPPPPPPCQQFQFSANPSTGLNQIIIVPVSSIQTTLNPHHHRPPSHHQLPTTVSPLSILSHSNSSSSVPICSNTPISTKLVSFVSKHLLNPNKLPSFSSTLLRKNVMSNNFSLDCAQIPSSGESSSGFVSFCDASSPTSHHRNGSLSSLTESDLSEYTTDLLSDEGSTLDDPMFDDIIGVGVDTDLELLLQNDVGGTLSF